MANDFILLRLNPLELNVDIEGLWFERSVLLLWTFLSPESAKSIFWP